MRQQSPALARRPAHSASGRRAPASGASDNVSEPGASKSVLCRPRQHPVLVPRWLPSPALGPLRREAAPHPRGLSARQRWEEGAGAPRRPPSGIPREHLGAGGMLPALGTKYTFFLCSRALGLRAAYACPVRPARTLLLLGLKPPGAAGPRTPRIQTRWGPGRSVSELHDLLRRALRTMTIHHVGRLRPSFPEKLHRKGTFR